MLSATSTEIQNHPTSKLVICRNCAHEFEGNFCNQCGQTAHTHAIDWHYIWHEIPHSVWHLDRGILFSLRELCTRPGHTIREFIEGKRVNHYRPLALLLILGAITAFVSHSLNISLMKSSQQVFTPTETSTHMKDVQAQMYHFMEEKQALGQIIMIPFFAFGFWRLFKRKGYSYPQLLVSQAFINNFSMLVSLVTILLFWLFGGTAVAFKSVTGFSGVAMIGYTVLANLQLFRDKLTASAIVVRTIVGYALGYLSFVLFVGFITAGVALYMDYQDGRNPKKASAPTQAAAPLPH